MPISNEVRDDLRGFLNMKVASGFSTASEIVESAIDFLSGEAAEDELRIAATEEIEAAIRRKKEEEATWPSVTDCDRLDSAFDALERGGIVCRQNFSCCGNCGAAEIWDEIETTRASGQGVRGYAFFHMQDTEGVAEGGGLYLNYGSVDEGEQPALAIAHEIVEQLRKRELNADWDGTWKRRIHVSMEWKRRFPDAATISS